MPTRHPDPCTERPSAAQDAPGRSFRDLAADYVAAVKCGTLQSDSDLARIVEARDPTGRFRTLGLAMRDQEQGRLGDAVAKLRTLRFVKRHVAVTAAQQIQQLAALVPTLEAGRGASHNARKSRHG